jgi:Lhr-like helicase
MITFGSSGIMNLVGYLTEDQIREFARQTGANRTKEMIAFWFKEVNLQNYLKMLKLLADYSGLFQIEEQIEAGRRIIVYHHNMGKNWSIYLEEGVRNVLTELFNLNAEIEISDNQIILQLPEQVAEAETSP